MPDTDDLLSLIEGRLVEKGMSPAAASRRAVGNPYLIYNLRKKGFDPKLGTLRGLCNALDLELYVGPPRADAVPHDAGPGTQDTGTGGLPPASLRDIETGAQTLNRAIADAGGNPIPDDLWPVLMERRGIAAVGALDTPVGEAQPDSTTAANDDVLVPFARDVRAAAGSGEMVFEEEADLHIAIPRSLLPPWIRPSGLIGLRAAGDSMEPTLNDGDVILLDRRGAEPIDGQVFVIHTDDGLVVKRLREEDEGWEMTSDNPVYPSRRSRESDRVVGRVAWSGPLRTTEAHGGR